jgi:hypothetical protein
MNIKCILKKKTMKSTVKPVFHICSAVGTWYVLYRKGWKIKYCRLANDTKRVIAEVYLTLHSSTGKNKLSSITLLLGAFIHIRLADFFRTAT